MSGPMPPMGLMAALQDSGKSDPDNPTAREQAAKAIHDKAMAKAAMIERGRLNRLHAERKKKRKQKKQSQRRNRK